jgi:DNA-directed RNA polymerase subunit RPC12/RpoP
MDIEFQCSNCGQSLSVDASGAGTEIECPACGSTILIPQTSTPPPPGTEGTPRVVNPIMASAAAREHKHFVVPQHEGGAESLITKPLKPLDAAAKETDKRLRVKSIRRTDCVEVGKDHFDEIVTDFVNKIGEANIISITTFNYSHQDLASREWITDMGVLIVYRS